MKQAGYLAVFALLCPLSGFGAAITTIDTACDPTVTTPASGGCTWYNFFLSDATGAPYGTGDSYQNYYVPAGEAPWTFTTLSYVTLRVVDGGHQGDTFDIYDNSVFLGTTSSTPIDAAYACGNDPQDLGVDPSACWNDSLFSRGEYLLAPGDHSLNILWNQRVPGGDSTIQWFELNVADNPVPEPSTFFLMGAGLVALWTVKRNR